MRLSSKLTTVVATAAVAPARRARAVAVKRMLARDLVQFDKL